MKLTKIYTMYLNSYKINTIINIVKCRFHFLGLIGFRLFSLLSYYTTTAF